MSRLSFKNSERVFNQMRKIRNENCTKLRRCKFQSMINERRNMAQSDDILVLSKDPNSNTEFDFESFKNKCCSFDYETRLNEFRKLKMLFSTSGWCQALIQNGIIEYIIPGLHSADSAEIQSLCCFILLSVSINQSCATSALVKEQSLSILLNGMFSSENKIAKACIDILCNITKESKSVCGFIVRGNICCRLLSDPKRLSESLGILENICRNYKFIDDKNNFIALLGLLRMAIERHCLDRGCINKAAMSIHYLSMNGNSVAWLIEMDVTSYMTDLLYHEDHMIQALSLGYLINLTAGTDENVRDVIDLGVLSQIFDILSRGEVELKENCLKIISNIALSSSEQRICLTYFDVVGVLKSMINTEGYTLRKMLINCFEALLSNEDEMFINDILESEMVPDLCKLLKMMDHNLRFEVVGVIDFLSKYSSEEFSQLEDGVVGKCEMEF